jgi:hypothetical protein
VLYPLSYGGSRMLRVAVARVDYCPNSELGDIESEPKIGQRATSWSIAD